MSSDDQPNIPYVRSPEENVEYINELTEELKNSLDDDKERTRKLKMRTEQLQQRLQILGTATISTRGQIAELENHLADQERDKYRLEGALDILQSNTR